MTNSKVATQSQFPVQGAGLGLRRPLVDQLMADPQHDEVRQELYKAVPVVAQQGRAEVVLQLS